MQLQATISNIAYEETIYHSYKLLLSLLLLKCTYLSDTVTQNAAGALYTVNKVSALKNRRKQRIGD